MDKIGLILVLITTISAVIRFLILPKIRSSRVLHWVKEAVYMIEEIMNEEKMGKEKKEFVMDFIQNKMNIKISNEDLDVVIETIVKEMNKMKKKR